MHFVADLPKVARFDPYRDGPITECLSTGYIRPAHALAQAVRFGALPAAMLPASFSRTRGGNWPTSLPVVMVDRIRILLVALTAIAALASVIGTVGASALVPRNVLQTAAPAQPVPFSHSQHAGTLELPCSHCHANVQPGIEMGLPQAAVCLACHAAIESDVDPTEQLKNYVASESQVPWNRVYVLMDGITWSHRIHTDAGMTCETCHGQVRTLDEMKQVTAVTAMATCIACHEAHDTGNSCETCHSWPRDLDLLVDD